MTPKQQTVGAWLLGLVPALLVVSISYGHLAVAADSVTYISAVESLRAGTGLGTWLESPLVVFPPGWPLLIAAGTLVGLGPETSALVWIVVSLVAIPPLTLGIMRRVSSSWLAIWGAVAGLALSPTIVSWGFGALSEVPFVMLVLAVALLGIRSIDGDDRFLWAAIGVGSIAPLLRYAGVGVPLGLAVWVLLAGRQHRRVLRSGLAAVVGIIPLGLVIARNMAVADSAMGVREPSLLQPLEVVGQSLEGLGRSLLWGLDVAPQSLEMVVGIVFIGVALVALALAYRSDRASEFSARLLLGGLGSAQLVVMVVSRMRVEIDDLGPRLLAPATVMLLLLVFAAVGDMAVCWSDASLGGLLQWRRIAAVATVVWCLVGVLATLRFALRDQVRGYDQDAYEAVRHSPVLDRLPEDCAELTHVSKAVPKARGGCLLVANEPWLWFRSDLRPEISPRNFGSAKSSDLTHIKEAHRNGADVFLLWTTVSRPKSYLITPEGLSSQSNLELVGESPGLRLYRLEPSG